MTTLESILQEFSLPPELPTEPSRKRLSFVPKPKVILFDIYGTLVAPHLGDLQQQLEGGRELQSFVQTARRFGFTEEIGRRWANSFFQQVERELEECTAAGIQRGEVLVEEIWRSLIHEAGGDCRIIPPKAAALYRELLENPVALWAGVKEALSSLKESGMLLGVASNAQFYTPLIMARLLGTSLESFLDANWVFFSYRLGFAKPDPHFFRLVRTRALRAGFQPRDVLMVGNDPENDVRCAVLHGLQAILFDPHDVASSSPATEQANRIASFEELTTAILNPGGP